MYSQKIQRDTGRIWNGSCMFNAFKVFHWNDVSFNPYLRAINISMSLNNDMGTFHFNFLCLLKQTGNSVLKQQKEGSVNIEKNTVKCEGKV